MSNAPETQTTPTRADPLWTTVERDGTTVRLVIRNADEYAAMKVFDEIVAARVKGTLTFELGR